MKFLVLAVLAIGVLVFVLRGIKEKEPSKVISIQTIDTLKVVEEEVAKSDADTLVILDVDYTLLQPSNPAFQQKNFQVSSEFIKNSMKTLPESIKNEFSTAIATSGEGQLLDEKSPALIEAFKQKGARVLVISGILAGKWNAIPDLMDWRIHNLKRLGITPSTFGFDKPFQFTDLPSYKGKYPEYKEGVILTNGELVKKQEVLDAFLKKLNWQPKKIIFIDDSRAIVEAMSQYASEHNLTFVGYEYKGAKQANSTPITKEHLEQEWQRLRTGLISEDG